MIKSIISDLGNVVISFDNHIFYRKISEYSSLSLEEVIGQVTAHLELSHAFDTGRMTPEEFYTQASAILKAKIDYDIFYSLYNDIFALNMPVIEILRSLQPEYRLVLCSNTDVMRFSFVNKRFPEICVFDRYVVSYEVGVLKPHPRIYELALREAGTNADESIFIDDREENTAAAESLGLKTILFGPETDLKTELQKKGVKV